jgi:hypothetical protein
MRLRTETDSILPEFVAPSAPRLKSAAPHDLFTFQRSDSAAAATASAVMPNSA